MSSNGPSLPVDLMKSGSPTWPSSRWVAESCSSPRSWISTTARSWPTKRPSYQGSGWSRTCWRGPSLASGRAFR